MNLKGFYRINEVDEKKSKAGILETIESLRENIEDKFGEFSVKIINVEENPNDKGYYQNEEKCFRVYIEIIMKNKKIKVSDKDYIEYLFYTKLD